MKMQIKARVLRSGQHIKRISERLTSSLAKDVLIETSTTKGVITLNRPNSLNALTLSMIEKLSTTLKSWEKEKSLMIIKGYGSRAFCAGGDMKEALKNKAEMAQKFYTLVKHISEYQIPYVSLIDGITMGGGAGLSVHGRFRVATERTVFAMPESTIGHFPDVGASYFLPRLAENLGYYLGLTGNRLNGYEVVKAGIATHFCESLRLPKLEKALLECKKPSACVGHILDAFSATSLKKEVGSSFGAQLEQIKFCFGANTVEGIVERLVGEKSEWAQKTLGRMRTLSPTVLKIIKKELDEGANKCLKECLCMEYRLVINMSLNHDHDFNEGVRAMLVDKDRKPRWIPATLEEVTTNMVDRHFKPLARDMELKL
uniref:3-hydroxyisobutyryl-CoA hydrolase, mitochondrial n=1 Tax=Timema genevievae TaxID=629358 RepID=A0A7R9JT21_TIMGE|nr:unnamed protein product [Timema genevievae]